MLMISFPGNFMVYSPDSRMNHGESTTGVFQEAKLLKFNDYRCPLWAYLSIA